MMRKQIKDLIAELRSWLPNYDHGPADYPTILYRVLAAAPGGEELEDMGYEPIGNLGWQELDQLGRVLETIQDKRDVEDLIRGLMSEEDVEEAPRDARQFMSAARTAQEYRSTALLVVGRGESKVQAIRDADGSDVSVETAAGLGIGQGDAEWAVVIDADEIDESDLDNDQSIMSYGRVFWDDKTGWSRDREVEEMREAPRDDTMSLPEIDEYLNARRISPTQFWQKAMGGDMAPLPRSTVERIAHGLGGARRGGVREAPTGRVDRNKIQRALAYVHHHERSQFPPSEGGQQIGRAEAAKQAIRAEGLNGSETEILLNALHVNRSEVEWMRESQRDARPWVVSYIENGREMFDTFDSYREAQKSITRMRKNGVEVISGPIRHQPEFPDEAQRTTGRMFPDAPPRHRRR